MTAKIGKWSDQLVVSGILLVSLIASAAALSLPVSPVHTLELRTIDLRFQIRPPVRPSQLVISVDADGTSSKVLGRWPWARRQHARLVRVLADAGARAVVYDVLFTHPSDPEDDRILAEELARAGNVFLAAAPMLRQGVSRTVQGAGYDESQSTSIPARFLWQTRTHGYGSPLEATGGMNPLPELLAGAKGLGHILGMPDADGIYRRIPLIVRVGDATFHPTLILPAVLDLQGLDLTSPRVIVTWGKHLAIQGANGMEVRYPIDDQGLALVNFPGRWGVSIPHYSFVDVLNAAQADGGRSKLREVFGGKLVVVSNTITGSTDVGATPTDDRYPLGELHVGELHAALADALLAKRFLRTLDSGTTMTIVSVIAGLTAGLVIFLSMNIGLFLAVLAMVVYLIGTWLLFSAGLILPTVLPTGGWAWGLLAGLAYRYSSVEKERRRIVAAFTGYLSPQVIRYILADPERIPLKGRRKELTILFADIEGFTSFTDRVEPEVIQKLLNEYFEAMTEIIFAHGGTLDKFMGDGLLAFFGDPEDLPNHAERAVMAAIAMQGKVEEMSEAWARVGQERLRIRIGINTGYATVGNLGSLRRMDYTVIGREVNLAQRIQAAAPPGSVVVSRRTHALAKNVVGSASYRQLEVKGISHPVDAYKVL